MSLLSGDPFEMPEGHRHQELRPQDWQTLMPITRTADLPFEAPLPPVKEKLLRVQKTDGTIPGLNPPPGDR